MHTLYLASGSPRRREILESLGYRVIRLKGDIDETPLSGEAASHYVTRMAREKNAAALSSWQAENTRLPDYPLITADTTVALTDQILGKPESAQHARDILQSLSGSEHQVLTAVSIYYQGQTHHTLQQSNVCFKTLTAAEIDAYIASGEPMDKAGAYGIQGLGGIFVTHLHGSFTGVMGLPVYETVSLLSAAGYPVPPFSMP
ncbi:Maf family protein [Neisseria sp. S1]|uniref:Maf family protein n=1 Tax=Neisseria sp. S1 TaxID=3318354 RepID=UPI003A8380D8